MKMLEFAKNSDKKLYIVGATVKGFQIYEYLKDNGIIISGFLSLHYDELEGDKDDIWELDEIKKPKECALIIAVKYKYYTDIISKLAHRGFEDFYFLSNLEETRFLQKYNSFYSSNVDELYYNADFYYNSAHKIWKYLFQFFQPNSIVDFGCGSGTWLRAAKDIKPDVIVHGFDFSNVNRGRNLNDEEFTLCNLETYEYKGPKYDMAISIEVAEHLEIEYAEQFVDNLCEASDIVLFSAAIKYQGGDHHVNEQYQSFWMKKFEKRGYRCIDCIRPTFWEDHEMDVVYRENCILYVKDYLYKSIINDIQIENNIMDMVHPYLFSMKMGSFYNGDF